jgi:hypothetical protein
MTDVLQNSNVQIVVRLYVVHCMCWDYFASGHGKEEVDSVSALLKHKIYKEQIKPQAHKFQNAHDVVNFCQEQSIMVVYIYCLRSN